MFAVKLRWDQECCFLYNSFSLSIVSPVCIWGAIKVSMSSNSSFVSFLKRIYVFIWKAEWKNGGGWKPEISSLCWFTPQMVQVRGMDVQSRSISMADALLLGHLPVSWIRTSVHIYPLQMISLVLSKAR